jgi:hypothetical protein
VIGTTCLRVINSVLATKRKGSFAWLGQAGSEGGGGRGAVLLKVERLDDFLNRYSRLSGASVVSVHTRAGQLFVVFSNSILVQSKRNGNSEQTILGCGHGLACLSESCSDCGSFPHQDGEQCSDFEKQLSVSAQQLRGTQDTPMRCESRVVR